ncbi:MAG: glutathione S-transferase [Gammaproteobacteria bacterium]
MQTPVLYSFRRCPYCMRAHLALKKSGLKIELREVRLSNLPEAALKISPKATVPILVLTGGTVMDESWDIVKWTLQQNDPDNWLGKNNCFLPGAEMLIETNDFSFKNDLDHYKYADRYPEHSQEHYRLVCEEFIEELEDMLTDNKYLLADQLSLADINIFPFIRQYSLVDKEWFDQSPYPKVQNWLDSLINSTLFQQVFQKHDIWQPGDAAIYL